MPDKDEKARRKQLAHGLREQQREKVRASLPAPVSDLNRLFSCLDEQLTSTECDHTLRLTREFLRKNALDETGVIPWLEQNGGYCDCEVLANVEDVVANAFPHFDQLRDDSGSVN